MSGPMMKILLAIAVFGITTTSNAETLSFPSFRIEVEDGWAHSFERGPQVQHEFGDLISIYHPNGNGILKMQSYNTPDFVSKKILRNMTNVDWSTPLTWQNWGDYSGYQYDYLEKGSFYRQWWLVNERTIIFIVYDSSSELKDIEIDEINKIVNSITINKPNNARSAVGRLAPVKSYHLIDRFQVYSRCATKTLGDRNSTGRFVRESSQ